MFSFVEMAMVARLGACPIASVRLRDVLGVRARARRFAALHAQWSHPNHPAVTRRLPPAGNDAIIPTPHWNTFVKSRHVFSTPDLATAQAAMQAARAAGIASDDISLIARSDIELEQTPEQHKEAGGDFFPGAVRGVIGGGATGLLAGLVAVAIPPIGITLAGAALLGVAGALVGSWTGAIAGSSVPDPVRRKFESEIEAGRILVVLDGDKDVLAATQPALIEAGATLLPFDTLTALT